MNLIEDDGGVYVHRAIRATNAIHAHNMCSEICIEFQFFSDAKLGSTSKNEIEIISISARRRF